jgi:RND superfamily putative drug exporter
VAIAIDATLVRLILVPAAMVLLGERCWWSPTFGGSRRTRETQTVGRG